MSDTLVKNASDPEQVRAAEKAEKIFEMQVDKDAKEILSTKTGRRFFWRYLTFCKVFSPVLADTNMIYFNEGMRNVGLSFLADINRAYPEAYNKMIEEHKQEEGDE